MKSWGIILLLPCLLWAQPEFFGYFESEADVMQLGAEKYSFGYNKLRVDLETRPNDNVLIGANINVQQYWGQTTWNIYDFIPGYANIGSEMNIHLPDTILLDNVYMKISFPKLDLTIGKQQISPGVGYAWNPTDIFNAKTLLDPSYEQTGVSVIQFEIPINSRSSLSGVFKPEYNWDNSTKQAWLNSGLGRFDYSITAAEYNWESTRGLIYQYESLENRSLAGVSIVGEAFGWGLWSEFAYNHIEYYSGPEVWVSSFYYAPDVDFNEIVVGVDHTFDNSVYLLMEYLHNDYGKSVLDELNIYDYLFSLSGNARSLMQDYGFLYLMHQTFDFVSLSAIAIANFNDGSGSVGPQVDWNIYQDTNISLQSNFSWGADNTEFGLQDWGLRLRLSSNF